MGLDAVELVLAWEESFGISITEAEGQQMRTPRQAIDLIYEKVKSALPEDHGCLSVRAFLRVRAGFVAEGVPRTQVRPEAKVASLLPGRQRRVRLEEIARKAGLLPRTQMLFGLQFTFGRVRDMVTDAVIQQHSRLRLAGHGWSRSQVREVVRMTMLTQLALRKFSDEAEFVGDLGVD